MARYTLHINRPALHGVGMKEARTKVRKVVRRTDTLSAVRCPVDTGLLRSTRQSNVQTSASLVTGEVKYTAEYAAAVHEGRRALTIRAKGNGRLRFVVDGRVVYARQVHQPARPGRPFLRNALTTAARSEGFSVTRR